jgi:hypothetical protein
MPLQNRVTPLNEIVVYPEHGLFMGNRGRLHNDNRQISRQTSSVKRWIICLTSFKDRQRPLMSPGQYTELFFLDEATALAAGHRPCATCRRRDYDCFKASWIRGNPDAELTVKSSINDIDARLHADRTTQSEEQRTFLGRLGDLPDGTFITLPDDQTPLLLWEAKLLAWTPARYIQGPHVDDDCEVLVRTPRSTVNALRAGYIPTIHSSWSQQTPRLTVIG